MRGSGWGRVRRRRTDPQGMSTLDSATVRSMNSPNSVGGCSSCGALYTRAPGDNGMCQPCRDVRATELSVDLDDGTTATGPAKAAGRPAAPIAKKAAPAGGVLKRPSFGRKLPVRRIAMGAAALLVVGGIVAAVVVKPKPVMDAWTAVKKHAPSDSWSKIRRQSTSAWTSVRHHASDAWMAVLRHTPFAPPETDRTASASVSRLAVQDSAPARTSKRSKKRGRE